MKALPQMPFFISLILSPVTWLSVPDDLLLSPSVAEGSATRKQNSLVQWPCRMSLMTALTFRVLLNTGSSHSSPVEQFSAGMSCEEQLSVHLSDLLNTNNLLN